MAPSLCLDSFSDGDTLHPGTAHSTAGPCASLQSFSLDMTAADQRLQLGLVIKVDATSC